MFQLSLEKDIEKKKEKKLGGHLITLRHREKGKKEEKSWNSLC